MNVPTAAHPDDERPRPLGVPATYAYPQVPVTRLLDDAATDFPETDAIDSFGHRLTYRELLDQVDRFATALRALGVTAGDRVGLMLPHCPQHLVAFFGGLRAGATIVLLDPSSVDLERTVNTTRCRVIVCLSPHYGHLERLKGRLPTLRHILATGFDDYLPFPRNVAFPLTGRTEGAHRRIPKGEGVTRFKDLIRRTAPKPVAAGTAAPALIAGGHVFEHAHLVAGAFQLRLWVPDVQAGKERLLNLAAPAGPFGVGATLGLGVLAAATMVFSPRSMPVSGRAGRHVDPTLMVADPAMFARLAADDAIPTSLRVGLADAPVDEGLVTQFHESIGGRLRGGLAAPQALGLTHADPVYGRSHPGSGGLALTDTETAVLDDDGSFRAAGQVGGIAVCGPQVADRKVDGGVERVRGRWALTGWRGRVDADGYVWPADDA
jgi:long-chain acyl-CoA synthetase